MNVQRFTKRIRVGLSSLVIGCLLAMSIIALVSPVAAVDGPVVTRDLPPTVVPGETFDVTVTFTTNADNFNAMLITDLAPTGWAVSVNVAWCTPDATAALATGNKAEITFAGADFPPAGTPYTAVYRVTVPGAATPGVYTFPDSMQHFLRYFVGGAGPNYVYDFAGDDSVEILPPPPDISVSPSSKNFDDVDLCSWDSQTFTVSNDGEGDLEVGTATITGIDADQFAIDNDNASGQTISPMDSRTLDVVFSPTSPGTKTASLIIPSNDPTVSVPLSGTVPQVPQPPKSQICQAIEEGVDWLVEQQNQNGSWGSCGDYWVGQTGLVLLKLETHATDPECGWGLSSPLDSDYPYHKNVQAGLDFLLDHAVTVNIGTQDHGNPDTNGNGKGTYFTSDCVSGHEPYETGCALMALAASREPDTYGDIAQDAVDWLAWAQGDSGWYRGGWGYYANDDWSDNSITGWVTLGLEYAESSAQGFECTIPGFVRSELEIWVDYIQCDTPGNNLGGSGYDEPCYWVNSLKTGNLLQQFEFLGDERDDPWVKAAVDYITRQWCDTSDCYYGPGWREQPGDPAHYHAMFSIMKGLESFGIEEIDGIDWFADIATVLLDQQNSNGSWPNSQCWCDSYNIRSTAWALLTLQKAVAKPPVPPKPSCSITATPTTGLAPLRVRFTAQLTGDIDKREWDFDDDGVIDSTEQNPTYTYMDSGRYTVTLEVTGPGGKSHCHTEIHVRMRPPEAKEGPNLVPAYLFISPDTVVPGQEVEISINIGNDGGTTGTRNFALYINGEVDQAQTVSVSPGSSKLLVFRVTREKPGVYQVMVEGNEGQFTVLAQAKARYWGGPLGTPGIIVIVVVAIVLIVAIVFLFIRRT